MPIMNPTRAPPSRCFLAVVGIIQKSACCLLCRSRHKRHTFATRLAAVCSNPHVARVLLGHAPRTTTDLYVHPTHEECSEAILRMAEEHDAALHSAAHAAEMEI